MSDEVSERLLGEARALLDANRRTGISPWEGRPFDYTCPSPGSYIFQWFWDSCFHAIALCHLDVERAAAELLSLLQGAQPNGFIPHIIFWQPDPAVMARQTLRLAGPYMSASVQPPVLALAVERVYRAGAGEEFRRRALPPTRAFFDWLAAHRDPDCDALLAIVQPDESGVDADPKYDALLHLRAQNNAALVASINRIYDAYRPLGNDDARILAADVFVVEDLVYNSIYAQGLQALARLVAPAEAAVYEGRAARVRDALIAQCWDEERGLFWSLLGQAETPARVNSISSLFPLIIEGLDRRIVDRLVREHLLNPNEYWLPYPLPSVAATEPTFNLDHPHGFIWRGPTWVNSNWFLSTALRRLGYLDAARHITRRTQELILRHGFYECFNPYTGQGQNARNFSWSTLVIDMPTG